MLKNIEKIKIPTTFLGLFLFLLYIIVYFYIDHLAVNSIKKDMQLETELISEKVLASIIKTQESTESTIKSLAHHALYFNLIEKQNNTRLLSFMKKELELQKDKILAIAFAFNPQIKTSAPFVYFKHDKVASLDLSKNDYNYLRWHWYKTPINLQQDSWSAPYFDEGGANTLITTYSYPLIQDEKVIAIVAADLELKWVQTLLEDLNPTHLDIFIVTKDLESNQTKYLAHTFKDETFKNETTLHPDILFHTDSKILTIGEANQRKFITHSKIGQTSWILGISYDEKEVMLAAHKFQVQILLIFVASFFILVSIIYYCSKGIIKKNFTKKESN